MNHLVQPWANPSQAMNLLKVGGHLWCEGRTLVHLKDDQSRPSHMPRGLREVWDWFHESCNGASAYTFSVVAARCLRTWMGQRRRPIRALDALCATGIRVRRWRNEINPQHQHRLHITANDLDTNALHWALASMESDAFVGNIAPIDDEQVQPEFIERNGIKFQQADARMAMVQGSFQWIDVDPFGSPITFIDGALQALGRVGVLEVTATDTAALTGSSSTSGMRRYGHKGIVDLYAHDDAVRVLLGTIATRAAQLDRAIEPILALFDGHHVRVSVRVRKSKQGADRNRELMGWRVRTEGKPYKFTNHPTPEELDRRVTPWITPLWNEEICSRLTEEYAVQTCLAQPSDVERGMNTVLNGRTQTKSMLNEKFGAPSVIFHKLHHCYLVNISCWLTTNCPAWLKWVPCQPWSDSSMPSTKQDI